MHTAKALILAGRTAHDRPWPSLGTGPKHLVPVANRPILFHNLEALRGAGLLEATIAVESDSEQATVDAVGDGSAWGLVVRYVRWRPQTGVNGALASARRFLADEPVLVGPADALHREPIHPHIATFAADRLDAMALSPAGAPQGVGGEPVAGGYLFSPRGVAALLERPRSLQDPLTLVRARGGQVRVQPIDGCLACHGGQERLLEGNRRMLESLVASVDRKAHPTAEFQGAVAIHPTARVEHTLIRGPAVIGPRATLSHAYIGPYTAIGADVHIEGTHIEHSIVLDGAELLHVGSQLETSVIGRGARIGRNFGLPAAMRLSIGDGAEVTLS